MTFNIIRIDPSPGKTTFKNPSLIRVKMTFNLCFDQEFWVKYVCIHIENSFGRVKQTYLQFPKCLLMFDTE